MGTRQLLIEHDYWHATPYDSCQLSPSPSLFLYIPPPSMWSFLSTSIPLRSQYLIGCCFPNSHKVRAYHESSIIYVFYTTVLSYSRMTHSASVLLKVWANKENQHNCSHPNPLILFIQHPILLLQVSTNIVIVWLNHRLTAVDILSSISSISHRTDWLTVLPTSQSSYL